MTETVYKDGRYLLCKKDGVPYLVSDGREYKLTCHPYEPCLYITGADGNMTAVHNSFDPVSTLDLFAEGGTVTSITGREYNAEDFCRMVEYAAGRYDIQIDEAEKVFGARKNKKEPEPPAEKAEISDRYPDDPAYDVIKEYPEIVIEYCIVKDELSYNGYNSHWAALAYACRRLFSDEEDGWHYNVGKADAKKIETDALFAKVNEKEEFNYRYAFLHPPCETHYTNADFDRVNEALFPNGAEPLVVYEWTTDWSEYFDDGHEWWGAMCYTVYDESLDRYVIIIASATD